MNYTKAKICSRCERSYVGGFHSKYCKECRPEARKLQQKGYKGLSKDWRKSVHDVWECVGRNNGSAEMLSFVRATERRAAEFLATQGFTNIVDLNSIRERCHFDLKAEKDGSIYVFQVTACYKTGGKTPENKILARTLGLEMRFVFVKPDLSICILKEVGELNRDDLRNAGLIVAQ